MEHRTMKVEKFLTREEDGKKYLDGYYSVFNQPYEICKGWIEEIAPGAFSRTLREGGDVKVLWNHNTDLVLGSTENRTAYLSEDERGLHGPVEINEADQDALNAYARVGRGDVRGCSFGFDIRAMEESWDEDGTYRTRLTDVNLFEVSPCTFPAYKQTTVSARSAENILEELKEKRKEKWRAEMLARLKGD